MTEIPTGSRWLEVATGRTIWDPSSQKECPPTAHPIREMVIHVGEPDVPPGVYSLPEYPGIEFRRLH